MPPTKKKSSKKTDKKKTSRKKSPSTASRLKDAEVQVEKALTRLYAVSKECSDAGVKLAVGKTKKVRGKGGEILGSYACKVPARKRKGAKGAAKKKAPQKKTTAKKK